MGLLKRKLFRNFKQEKIKFDKFNPHSKTFSEDILNYLQKAFSKNTIIPVKIGWIKDEKLPLITITKGMDEIQKLYEKKIVSFDFNIWSNNKDVRDSVSNKIFNIMKNIEFGNLKVNLSEPQILNFEEKYGIYRGQFNLTIQVRIKINKKDLEIEKAKNQRGKLFEKLVLGKSSIGGDILESEDKKIFLFKPNISKILALIENNKILWKKEINNMTFFDLSKDGSYVVAVGQLQKKEMLGGYKSGGHIYLFNKEGKIKDIKIPCDGLSCSISPNGKNFGITTMGPEWGVYYFDNKGKLIWKKIFDKRIGGIELTKSQIILYDKMHKETRKKLCSLDIT